MKRIIKFMFITSLLIITGCSKDITGATRYNQIGYNKPSYRIDIIYEDNKITGMGIYFEYTIGFVSNELKQDNPSEYLEILNNYFEQEALEIRDISPIFIPTLLAKRTPLDDYPAISIDLPDYIPETSLQIFYHFNLKDKDFSEDNEILKNALDNLGLSILLKKDVTLEELLADKNFIFRKFFENEDGAKHTFTKEEYEWLKS